MNKPILFEGRYDINVRSIKMVLDTDRCDGTRLPLEEHDIIEAAIEARLSIAIEVEVDDKWQIRDIRDAHDGPTGDAVDLFARDVAPTASVPVFTEVRAETERGKAFLEEYLPRQEVRAECRNCGSVLVGDEVLRNRCLCLECEADNPDYFA
jgi:hypothetical protein